MLLLGLGAGCTRVTLVDDVDLALDWNPLVGPGNALNSPYVEGSSMRIYVNSSDDGERYVGWRVTSTAPTVFSVEPLQVDSSAKPATAYVRGHAKSPGVAELQVFDERDQYVGGDVVEVRRPDELRLLSHGMLLVGFSEEESRVRELRVLEGGTATYLARYYSRGAQLSGNGALSVPATAPIGQPVGGSASVQKSFVFEDRDWLQLTPQSRGSAEVQLLVNGTPFSTFPIVAVSSADVAAIRILNQAETEAKNGDWLVSYAQAVDTSDREIAGVEYVWQIDQTMQKSLGDLFRYEYDARQPRMLTASFGGMAAQTFIHAKKGFVDSTNRIGCSAVPGLGSTAPMAAGPALLALFGLLTRRRSRRLRRRLRQ